MMRDLDIVRWRMRSQRLAGPVHDDAYDVVRSLLCVQAENAAQAAWAVATRTERREPADLARALDSGAVLRTHVLRPTWHFVSADDVAWLIELTGPKIKRTVLGKQLTVAHGLTEKALAEAQDAVVDIVSEYHEPTRAHIVEQLAARGVKASKVSTGAGGFVMLLLAYVELSGLICSGSPAEGEHTYALLADRAPNARRLDRDEALGELARRYAVSHGPVTERDLAYWATLTLGDVRRGFEIARDNLESFEHDGRMFWHAPGESAPPRNVRQEPRAHLLQIFDEIYRGYQDSRWLLDIAGLVPRTREKSTGMALFDAQLVAAVRRAVIDSQVSFEVNTYRELRAIEKRSFAHAAARYGEFLQRDPVLTYA